FVSLLPIRRIHLRQRQKLRFSPAGVFGASSRLLTKQKEGSRPSSVILVGQNRNQTTNWSPPRRPPIANTTKSHTTPKRFLTTSCSISTGAKLTRRKRTGSSPILVPVIAPRFFMVTPTRKKSPKLQKRSSRSPASSKNRL